MRKKKFYQETWFWCIIAGLIIAGLFTANLLYAGLCKSDTTANILTAISGWVSFLATAGIGVIAFWQTKRYQEENSKQTIIQTITTKKNEFDLIIEQFTRRTTMIDFIQGYFESTPQKNKSDSSLSQKIDNFVGKELRELANLKRKLKSDTSFALHKKELFDQITQFENDLLKRFFEANLLELDYSVHRYDDENAQLACAMEYFTSGTTDMIKSYASMKLKEILEDQVEIKKISELIEKLEFERELKIIEKGAMNYKPEESELLKECEKAISAYEKRNGIIKENE